MHFLTQCRISLICGVTRVLANDVIFRSIMQLVNFIILNDLFATFFIRYDEFISFLIVSYMVFLKTNFDRSFL